MGARVILFKSRKELFEDLSREKESQKQNLYESILCDFKLRINQDSYNQKEFLISDIWELYIKSRESFGLHLAFKAIQIAKSRNFNKKKMVWKLRYFEECIESFEAFACFYEGKIFRQEDATGFMDLCAEYGDNRELIDEALSFLKLSGRNYLYRICKKGVAKLRSSKKIQ